MNRILLKISFSKNNLAAGNFVKESLLRMPALMFNLNMNSSTDKCREKKQKYDWCPKKKMVCKVKPEPCCPKPCKQPRFDCPPNDPPNHCPYKPPKCKKTCIAAGKPCIPPKNRYVPPPPKEKPKCQ